MKTAVTVQAFNADESVGVTFSDEVAHRKNATPDEILQKATAKMRTFLKRYNPAVLSEMVSFNYA